MLLMIRTQPTIQRTSVTNLSGKLQWDRPRFVIRSDLHIQIRIAKEQRLELPMLGTFLVDKDFSIPQKNARINHLATLRANGLGQLPENFLAVFFDYRGFHA